MRQIKTSMFNCGSVLFVRLFCFEVLCIIDIALYHRYKVRAQYREYMIYFECNTIAFFFNTFNFCDSILFKAADSKFECFMLFRFLNNDVAAAVKFVPRVGLINYKNLQHNFKISFFIDAFQGFYLLSVYDCWRSNKEGVLATKTKFLNGSVIII